MILANYYMKVTQVESLITKMQKYVLEVCQVVNSLMLPSEANCISVYFEVTTSLSSYQCHSFDMVSSSIDWASCNFRKQSNFTVRK